MGAEPRQASIQAAVIQGLISELNRMGAPCDVLLEQAGLCPSVAALDPTTKIDEGLAWTLLDLAAAEVGPDFGRKAGQVGLLALGSLGARVGQAGTLWKALETLVTGAQQVSDKTDLWVSTHGDQTWLCRNPDAMGARTGADQAELYMISMFESIIQLVAGQSWQGKHVRLRYDSSGAFSDGTRTNTGQAYSGLSVPTAWLYRPLLSVLHPHERVENSDVSRLRRLTTRETQQGRFLSLDEAAEELGVSTRSLKRRLSDDGLTYRQLQAQVRLKGAHALLRDPDVRIGEVGRHVGYRDPGHFTRAFCTWTGTLPSVYRESLQDLQ